MSDISELTSTMQSVSSSTSQSSSDSLSEVSMGKDDFLELLVTQLENQDPLDPADSKEFSAQLAQFSSLEQLYNINDNLAGLEGLTGEMERLGALNMLDKSVVVQDDSFKLEEGMNSVELGYNLENSADKVSLKVMDSNGDTVASFEGQEGSVGQHTLSWNFADQSNPAITPGEYTLHVSATSHGESIKAQPLVQAYVQGLETGKSGNELLTNLGSFGLDQVLSIVNS